MAKAQTPLEGAFILPEDVTLADIWSGIHADATAHHQARFAPDVLQQQAAINDSSRSLMRALSECAAPRWHALIESLGVTQYGAIALSWCKGAKLSDVAETYAKIAARPGDMDRRTLSFLAPGHGASERRLSALVDLAQQDVGILVMLCLGHPSPLVFDMDKAWLDRLPTAIGKILLERYDLAQSRLDAETLAKWRAVA